MLIAAYTSEAMSALRTPPTCTPGTMREASKERDHLEHEDEDPGQHRRERRDHDQHGDPDHGVEEGHQDDCEDRIGD